MGLRRKVETSLKSAERDGDTSRLCTLRLINAALKDLEIAQRGCEEGTRDDCSDRDVLDILSRMLRQREESERSYEEAGRLELAAQERDEARIIAEFLPRPFSDEEKARAIDAAISDAGAGSLRDLGRVIGLLKQRHAGRLDFTAVAPEVRDRLAS